jgi:hypothetical protein
MVIHLPRLFCAAALVSSFRTFDAGDQQSVLVAGVYSDGEAVRWRTDGDVCFVDVEEDGAGVLSRLLACAMACNGGCC